MEDLKTFTERIMDEKMKEAGFTVQTPQKEKKDPAVISGTITFIGHGRMAAIRQARQAR